MNEVALGQIADSIRLDDSTESGFNAKQILAQQSGKPIYMDRFVVADVGGTLLPGVGLISNHLGGFTGSGIWEPSDGNSSVGLLHVKRKAGWRWGTKVATANFRSEDEKFIECDQATMDSGAPGSSWHSFINIRNPYVQDCTYAQTWRRARNVFVDGIEVRYSKPDNTRHGVEIAGGQEIHYRDYKIFSGRTGIVAATQSNLESPRNILLEGGEVWNVSEEALSIDTRANEPVSTALFDHFRVTGKDNEGVCATSTYLCVDWTLDTIADIRRSPAGSYAGRDITVVKGANKNTSFRISNAPNWVPLGPLKNSYKFAFAAPITVEQASSFKEGDLIAITAAPQYVRVVNPKIHLGSPLEGLGWQTGISYWGGGYGCELTGAQIFGSDGHRNGVRLAHVAGILPRSTAFARRDVRSQLPVVGVRINDLTLYDCDLTLTNVTYGPLYIEESYKNYVNNLKLVGTSMSNVDSWVDSTRNRSGVLSFEL